MVVRGVVFLLIIGCRASAPEGTSRTVPSDGNIVQVQDSATMTGVAVAPNPGEVVLPLPQPPLSGDAQIQAWLHGADAVAIVHVGSFVATEVDGPPFARTQIQFAVDKALLGTPPPLIVIDGGALPTGDVIAPHSPHFETNLQYLVISQVGALVASCALLDSQTVNVFGDSVTVARIQQLLQTQVKGAVP